jgi:hypothetical protein
LSKQRARLCELQEDDAHLFDGDVARAKSEVFRSRRFIASAKRELEGHEQWLQHHDLLWREDLKQCQRRIRRKHANSARKDLAFSLILFVARTCRALFYKTVWLLHSCGRWIFLIGASWFVERARVLGRRSTRVVKPCISSIGTQAHCLCHSVIESIARRQRPLSNSFHANHTLRSRLSASRELQKRSQERNKFRNRGRVRSLSVVAGPEARSRRIRRPLFFDWTRHATLGWGLGIASVTLLAVDVIKPVGPGEEIQSPVRLAAINPGGPHLDLSQTRGPSSSEAPGLNLMTSVAMPEPLPLSGEDVAGMILPTAPVTLEPADSAPGFTLITTASMPKPPPFSGKDISSLMLLTTPLAAAPAHAETTEPAPVANKPLAEPKAKQLTPLGLAPAHAVAVKPAPVANKPLAEPKAKQPTPLGLAPAHAETTKPAPAVPKPIARKPKTRRQPELASQRPQGELQWRRLELTPRVAIQRPQGSSFVPHSSW